MVAREEGSGKLGERGKEIKYKLPVISCRDVMNSIENKGNNIVIIDVQLQLLDLL